MNKKIIYTLIMPGIIFFGFFKQYIYYSFFNINISEYIDFDEILTSFLDDLFLFIFIIFTTSIIFIYLVSKAPKSKNVIAKKITEGKRGLIIDIILIIFFIVTYILVKSIFLIYFCIFISINIIDDILTRKYLNLHIRFTIIAFMFYISILILYSAIEYIFVFKTNQNKYTITYKINDECISDSTNIYVGKTKKYIFFVNYNKNIVEIIPNSNVLKISKKIKMKLVNVNNIN